MIYLKLIQKGGIIMKNIILAGFDGTNNSARIITEGVSLPCSKLILPNDKEKSAELLLSEIRKKSAVCVVMLGQKPQISDKIAVEPRARENGEVLHTALDCTASVRLIKESGYDAYISKGCGNSYCSHIYYECLRSGVNCIFLHIPFMENISDIKRLTEAAEGFISGLSGIPACIPLKNL